MDLTVAAPRAAGRTVDAMTTRRATVLSVLGVIVAGLVAAVVNAEALAGGNGRHDGLLASPQPAPATVVPSSTLTVAPTEPATIATSAPAAVLHAFAAGPAGTVTLDGSSGVLTLVAVVPSEGWLVSSVSSDGAGQVVVRFTSMGQDLVATGVLTDGVIAVQVVSETPGPGTVPDAATLPSTVATAAPGTTEPRPVATEPRPTVTASATTTTVHDDDDDVDDHGGNSGSGSGSDDSGGGSGDDHDEPDD